MLTMEQIKYIRKCVIKKGESIRSVSKRTGQDWRTVQKYVQQEDFNEELRFNKKGKSKLDKFKPIIDNWLQDDLKMPAKQRHTATRVYDRLKAEYGEIFNASIRTVSTYVAAKKKELFGNSDAYLPLTHPAGEAQADFGEFIFSENGLETKGYYLNLAFPYSNASYWQVFRGQNLECLLTGLKAIFEYIGGVPTTIWFDNLSPVVAAIKRNGERKLTEGFERFAMHFNFEHNFCNPNSGHEKGSVEAKVGYNRRNYFVPMPTISSIDEYNKSLLAVADKDMNRLHYKKKELIANLFESDRTAFLQLPKYNYDVYKLEKHKVNSYGKITVDKGYIYSISPSLAGKEVWVKVTVDKVIILDDDYKQIIAHERLYGSKYESMNWLPYLDLMSKRPNALKYTGFYTDMPQSLKEYFDSCKLVEKRIGLKVLCKMLDEINIHRASEIFKIAQEKNLRDSDSLTSMFYKEVNNTPILKDIELLDHVPHMRPYDINIAAYDDFIRGGIEHE
jgi:transposase